MDIAPLVAMPVQYLTPAGLVVLHHEKDFDLIAAVTGQPVERLAVGDVQG